MRRRVIAAVLAGVVLVGCGASGNEPEAPTPATIDPRCAQLSQEVTDAYQRGDTEAQRAAEDEFDRLTEAGECD
jgi:hypothetical protein